MNDLRPLIDFEPERLETRPILKKLATASRQLAELKGVAASIPNQGILISSLELQEAKDSSAIENIVTTHDDIFRNDLFPHPSHQNPAIKEVQNYRDALHKGFLAVRQNGLLTTNHILTIQEALEKNNAGFRKVPGTTLQNNFGEVVYTPPQDAQQIVFLMNDLERFINQAPFDMDPLIKMALIHHQFESIHPFFDGNGRTGRIINVLYLVKEGLLDIPVLYLSSYIVKTKADYYRLLQEVRENDDWENWVLYMLDAVENTATEAIQTISVIQKALQQTKYQIRDEHKHKFYSQDLINHLFRSPYTKIDFLADALQVSRITATGYLDKLSADGILAKHKIGRSNYYINIALYQILTGKHL